MTATTTVTVVSAAVSPYYSSSSHNKGRKKWAAITSSVYLWRILLLSCCCLLFAVFFFFFLRKSQPILYVTTRGEDSEVLTKSREAHQRVKDDSSVIVDNNHQGRQQTRKKSTDNDAHESTIQLLSEVSSTLPTTTTTTTSPPLLCPNGKPMDRLLWLLQQSGMENFSACSSHEDDARTQNFPTWQSIVNLYGPEPVFWRRDCRTAKQRDSNLPPLEPRIAGLYNTGTNAAVQLLLRNVPHLLTNVNHNNTLRQQQQQRNNNTKTTYFDHDVPWGKHVPAVPYRERWDVRMPGQADIPNDAILSVVMVRDPYSWMQSTCKNSYGLKWKRDNNTKNKNNTNTNQQHCPNLIMPLPSKQKKKMKSNLNNTTTTMPVPVKQKMTVRRQIYTAEYASLVHVWTTWYQHYYMRYNVNTTKKTSPAGNDGSSSSPEQEGETRHNFPVLMVRFEDVLYHPAAVIRAVVQCATGSQTTEFNEDSKVQLVTSRSKFHGGGTSTNNLSQVLLKYARAQNRLHTMTPADIKFAKDHFEQQSIPWMDLFHYQKPSS